MNQFGISLIVLLLPGIIAAVICDQITRHKKWTYFTFSVHAILFGWLSYVLLHTIKLITPDTISFSPFSITWLSESIQIWGVLFDINGKINEDIFKEVFHASLTSILLAFIASALINYKVLNKAAQFLKISTKYGDENLFSYYLNLDVVRWIYVRDISRNLTYKGEIVFHSENEGIQELVLSE